VSNLKQSDSFDTYLQQVRTVAAQEQDTLPVARELPTLDEGRLTPTQREILRRIRIARETYMSERLEWDGCSACADELKGIIDHELRLIEGYFNGSYTKPQNVLCATYATAQAGYGAVLVWRQGCLRVASTHPFANALDEYLERHRFEDEPPKEYIFEGTRLELTQLTRTVFFQEELAAL